MKKLDSNEMRTINGGGTATSYPCPYCGRTFSRFYLTKYWKAYAEGRVVIDLRTHMYDCAEIYG